MANVHEHQIEFMKAFEKQDGISFLIIFFSARNEFFYLPFKKLLEFWERGKNGGWKSFKYEELDPKYCLPIHAGVLVPYLDGLARDLEERD